MKGKQNTPVVQPQRLSAHVQRLFWWGLCDRVLVKIRRRGFKGDTGSTMKKKNNSQLSTKKKEAKFQPVVTKTMSKRCECRRWCLLPPSRQCSAFTALRLCRSPTHTHRDNDREKRERKKEHLLMHTPHRKKNKRRKTRDSPSQGHTENNFSMTNLNSRTEAIVESEIQENNNNENNNKNRETTHIEGVDRPVPSTVVTVGNEERKKIYPTTD